MLSVLVMKEGKDGVRGQMEREEGGRSEEQEGEQEMTGGRWKRGRKE